MTCVAYARNVVERLAAAPSNAGAAYQKEGGLMSTQLPGVKR